MTRRRVAFLYIAQPHQVLHSISAAVELARLRPDFDVEVLATSQPTRDEAQMLIARLGGALVVRLLGPAWLRALARDQAPPPKVPALAANLGVLARYDIIVAPERTTAAVRRMGLRRQKLVYTQHGAGDRGGPFEPRLRQFDLVFAAGAKQRDRMLAEGLVTDRSCTVVGYPKFDVVDALAEPLPRLFAEDRPIVVYNPHFDPRLSSWPSFGVEVLRAFAEDRRYNLIFAPHIRLFEEAGPAEVAKLAAYRDHPAIHIDLGSRAAIDMTYTRMADVYLGDASSQIYEFLRTPRPCLFLDAHHVAWRGDESYRHWRFGPVLERVDSLIDAVDAARASHGRYEPEQAESFRYSFDQQPQTASVRAALAIADLAMRP